MVKTRPVIVVSRRLKGRPGLVSIVPVSMTPPREPAGWHVRVPADEMPPGWRDREGDRWAKCDMAMVVSLERLSHARAHASRTAQGILTRVSEKTLSEIRTALAYVFELDACRCEGACTLDAQQLD